MGIQPAKQLSNLIVKNKFLQKSLEFTDKNPGLVTGVTAFGLSTTIKPATIMLMPTNKEDCKYTAAKCVADGFVDLAFSYAIFTPLSKGINMAYDKLVKDKVLKKSNSTKKAVKTIYNRGGRVFLAPLKILITLALVPKVVGMFKNANNKKHDIQNSKVETGTKANKINFKA
jgi:hypothetical protein